MKLDDTLGQGRRVDDKRGLGFIEKGASVKTTVFIREGITQNSSTDNKQVRVTKDTSLPVKFSNRRTRRIYYFCGLVGHIRPYCLKYQLLMRQRQDTRQNKYLRRPRTEWRPKINSKNCKVALTSIKCPNSTDWYFNSGCSRHMTGNADFFSELSECKARSVVFGDEGKGKIIGKRMINRPDLPFLLDVRLV